MTPLEALALKMHATRREVERLRRTQGRILARGEEAGGGATVSKRKNRTPQYEVRRVPPLSDGRTPGICMHCGKQHPNYSGWETDGKGCAAKDAVLAARSQP